MDIIQVARREAAQSKSPQYGHVEAARKQPTSVSQSSSMYFAVAVRTMSSAAMLHICYLTALKKAGAQRTGRKRVGRRISLPAFITRHQNIRSRKPG